MARNNKRINFFRTTNDLLNRAKEIQDSISKPEAERTMNDIYNIAEHINKGTNIVLESNVSTVPTGINAFKQNLPNGDNSNTKKAIENLGKIDFFNIVSGKHETGKDTMLKAIDLTTEQIKLRNQKGKANESINQVLNKVEKFKRLKENGGSFFVYDLETIGGTDNNGIWKPTGITEFSMHQYDAKTGDNISKLDIVVGWDKKEATETLERIEKAIANGTIDKDKELSITAHRLSLYGDKRTNIEMTDDGYFTVKSFIDSAEGSNKDIKRIRAGVQELINVRKNTIDDINGVPMDISLMMKSLANTNEALMQGNSMLIGYNHLLHDNPIMNQMGNKYLEQYPQLQKLFKEGFNFASGTDDQFDIMGLTKHFKTNFSTQELLPGIDISQFGERLNRQEILAEAILGSEAFKKAGPAHVAGTDVSVLFKMIYEKSDLYNGKNLIEYAGGKLAELDLPKEFNFDKNLIFQAKGAASTYDGKNMINFAIDNATGKVYTATNAILENGKASIKGFNVGSGINKDGFYKISNIQKIQAGHEYIDAVKDALPQYSSQNLFAITMDRVVSKNFKETKKMNNLSHVSVFTSESEMYAFIANQLNIVGKMDEANNKYEIYDKDAFDLREYKNIKNNAVFSDVDKNYQRSNKEKMLDAVDFQAQKTLTSRAENWANGENSYKNISKIVEIQTEAQKKINKYLKPRELEMLMAENVAAGAKALSIEENVAMQLQKTVTNILKNQKTGELLDSSIDNASTYLGVVADRENYYNVLLGTLNKNDKFIHASDKVKQQYFSRVDRALKEDLARGIYDNESRIKKSIAQDSNLKTSLSKFKGMYEFDLSKMSGVPKVTYTDITQSNPANLLRLDLTDTNNLEYKIINNVREAVYGKKIKNTEEVNKKAMRNFYGMLLEDDNLKKEFYTRIKDTNEWRLNDFGKELKEIATNNKYDYSTVDVTSRVIKSLENVKKAKPTAGIISEHLFMKDLEASPAFTRALNKDANADMIKKINNIMANTTLVDINGSKTAAKRYAQEHLLDNLVQQSDSTAMVYKSARQEMLDYLTELTLTVDKAGGTLVSSEGNIAIHANGERINLNLPKIKQDTDSGVWYIETGNMKNQLKQKLNINNRKGNVKISLGTNLGADLNAYPISRSIERIYAKDGQTEAIRAIETAVNSHKKKVIAGSTINNFNGNDIYSNSLIDLNDLSNVMEDLFSPTGNLNYLIKDKKFLDKTLQEVMEQDVMKYIKAGNKIEDLDSNMVKELSKNIGHILEALAEKANVTDDAMNAIKKLTMSGSVKQTSSMVGVVGDMPVGAINSIFDDTKRPPVLQALNAIPVREADIKKAGFIAGNLITTKAVEKETAKMVSGIGKTTTDVMMDIAYLDVDAISIIKNAHFDKVIKNNTVEEFQRELVLKALDTMSKMNTYEQERHMNPEVFESIYGITSAQVQNISGSKDYVSALGLLPNDEAKKQTEFLMSHRGAVRVDENKKLVFESATGTHVKRGDALIKTLGYGDKLETFSPKIKNGVFLHQYVKSNGMILRDDEITDIINNHKELFLNADGTVKAKENVASALEELMSTKYSATGIYRVEDINAMGYVKATTSAAEKGMTNLNYVKTGELNANVRGFFQDIGIYDDVVRGNVLTDKAVDALLKNVNDNRTQKLLNKHGFNNVDNLKAVMKEERLSVGKYISKEILGGKADIIANDDIAKHSGAGQTQFGRLNKAISNLIETNKGDSNKTAQQIADIINNTKEFQFLELRNLKAGTKKAYEFSAQEGRLFLEYLGTNAQEASISNAKSLSSLVNAIDKLSGKSSGKQNLDGIIDVAITKEVVKILPDVETQSGTDAAYFELQETLKLLKSQKDTSNSEIEKVKINEKIVKIEEQIKNYESGSKRMKLGNTEIQLLDRIRVTEKHAEQIESMIRKGELTDEIIASQALRGKVIRDENGAIAIDKALTNKSALDSWINDFKNQLTYNPLKEDKLTAADVLTDEYEHLAPIFKKANSMKRELGKDSAEKIFKLDQAKTAVNYNKSKSGYSEQYMIDKGFEKVHISDINWDADEIAKKDLLIDLGEKFEGNRYIAVAGTGHKMNVDDEILTNGQKKLLALSHRYKDWKYHTGSSREGEYFDKVQDGIDDAKKAISQSIYGKNAYRDQMNKIEINDANYRYKASGIVVSENDVNLMRYAKENGLELDTISTFGNLTKAEIDGRTLAEHHLSGKYYDYKFVSLEAIDKMGMFSEKTMKAYGAQSKEDMIEMLKKYGTMDITDRYPNNKNDSMLLTHVFLDETLQGNQTKVAGHSGLKMLLDHDGDSESSFILRRDGIDYGAFQAQRRAVIKNLGENASEEAIKTNMIANGMSEETYDSFRNMEATTTIRAMTENKPWKAEVDSILNKDRKRNSSIIGNIEDTVAVKNGQSVLGEIAIGSFSHPGTREEVMANEEAVNTLIAKAGDVFNKLDVDTKKQLGEATIPITEKDLFNRDMGMISNKIITDENSAELLDKSLTVLQKGQEAGLITKEALGRYEADAITRIGIDKSMIASYSKTGTAATGNINVVTSSIKNAAHDMLIDTNAASADMIRSVLDIPEQAAISSKKIKSAYDDTRARDITEILNNMFNNKNNQSSTTFSSNDISDFKSWFMQHGKGDLADIYDKSSNFYLSKSKIAEVDSYIEGLSVKNLNADDFKNAVATKKAEVLMDATTKELTKLSSDEQFQAKRLNYKSRGNAENIGAAHVNADEYANIIPNILDWQDDTYKIRQNALKQQTQEAMEKQKHFNQLKSSTPSTSNTVRQTSNMITELADKMLTHTPKVGSGLGMMVLGFAGGMLASGYAMGNPLNDKPASQVAGENQQQMPVETMSIPDFMDKQGGYVTGNTQQGYIINIKADTKKGRKHMQNIMKQAAQASVGGAVSVNMNIRNISNRGITDTDIENFLDKHM